MTTISFDRAPSTATVRRLPTSAHAERAFPDGLVADGARPVFTVPNEAAVRESLGWAGDTFVQLIAATAGVATEARGSIDWIADAVVAVAGNSDLSPAGRAKALEAKLDAANAVPDRLVEQLELAEREAARLRAVNTAARDTREAQRAAIVRHVFESMGRDEAGVEILRCGAAALDGDQDAIETLRAVLDAPKAWRSQYLPGYVEAQRDTLTLATDPDVGARLHWLDWAATIGHVAVEALRTFVAEARAQVGFSNDLNASRLTNANR
ncbi:MAG: hypothetical protein K2R93_15275 [Gemmatimonadaceae bacterium]|nr:hypothetical protein [Gemmatimonadaceae bacterium]